MTERTRVTWADVRALFQRRGFQALVSVRVVGQIGDGMVQAALTSFVLFSPERQATPLKIAAAFAILLLPYSVFGPFIGVLIDRWPRQRILVFASLLRAASVGLIAIVVTSGDDGVLLGTSVLISLGIGRFLQATLSAALPHVARDRELVTANAFAPTAGTIASALGGVIGVAVAQAAGTSGTLASLAVASVTGMASAWIASTVPRNELGPDVVKKGIAAQMRAVAGGLAAGWRHLAERERAWRAMAVVTVHRSAFGMISVTAVILLRHAINANAHASSALVELAGTVGGAAIGAFIGAVMAPVMVSRRGIREWMRTSLLVGAVTTAIGVAYVIAFPHSMAALPTLMTAGAFIGWTGQTVKVCSDSLVQSEVLDSHRGRVFAIYDMVLNVGLFSGIFMAAIGLSADGRSLFSALYIAAALLLAVPILRVPPVK